MQISAFRIVPSDHLKKLERLNIGGSVLETVGGFQDVFFLPGSMLPGATMRLPVGDNSAAEIRSFGFLHQLDCESFRQFMNDCHRVLDPEGTAVFRVPNAMSQAMPGVAISDPMHRMLFTARTFDYLTEGTEQYEARGKLDGFKPWRLANLFYLDGDATIQATLQPVKEEHTQ
jgi:hypothetical protein